MNHRRIDDERMDNRENEPEWADLSYQRDHYDDYDIAGDEAGYGQDGYDYYEDTASDKMYGYEQPYMQNNRDTYQQQTYASQEYETGYEQYEENYKDDYIEDYTEEYQDVYDDYEVEDDFFEEDPPIDIKRIGLTAMIVAGTIIAIALLIFLGGKVIKLVRGEIDPLEAFSEQTTNQTLELKSEETVEDTDAIQVMEETVVVQEEKYEILVSQDVPEVEQKCMGIDVSKYQGVINWKKVADSGVKFAMIRVGYRSMESGQIKEDEFGKYNLQEATENGIQVGAYFFSSAVNEAEAEEEARWVNEVIKNYPITYPVAFNSEGFDKASNRHYGLSREERTAIAKKYLDTVYAAGYTPMFYASSSEMTLDQEWLASDLEKQYKVWVSWYSDEASPENGQPQYDGKYAMWQYSCKGKVDGIHTEVDQNVAYFGYETVAIAHDTSVTPERQKPDYEALLEFADTNTTVTAKIETNLRDIPDQSEDSHVMCVLKNGEVATVTGVCENGWSRVNFNGNTYYAVSQYLVEYVEQPDTPAQTEVVAQPEIPVQGANGIKTVFTDCNEQVTAKIEVNLRKLPSVTNPDAVVVATIRNGDIVTRTGYNSEYGWSRVEYNGEVLYCVSSYLTSVQ